MQTLYPVGPLYILIDLFIPTSGNRHLYDKFLYLSMISSAFQSIDPGKDTSFLVPSPHRYSEFIYFRHPTPCSEQLKIFRSPAIVLTAQQTKQKKIIRTSPSRSKLQRKLISILVKRFPHTFLFFSFFFFFTST